MSYGNWGTSFYDNSTTNSESWQPTNQAYSQPEQYNPFYPSLDGSSDFFSSSTQHYEPYFPSKKQRQSPTTETKTSSRKKPRKKEIRTNSKQQSFHLITQSGSGSWAKLPQVPDVSKIGAAALRNPVKVARGNSNIVKKPATRGGRGIQKMPNYRGLQGNIGDGNSFQSVQGRRGGGRGRGRGGRGVGVRFNGPPKPSNNKDDIKFEPLPDDAPAVNLVVSPENVFAFHGFDSVFTTQHHFPVLVDSKIYTSCDHYYQIRKVVDLTGVSSDKMNNSVRDETGKLIVESSDADKKGSFSAIAREILKASNISKEKVDEWRRTKGLEAIQKAMLAKTSQSAHLREALKETGDRILAHAYARDSIYGTGCTIPAIKKWLDDMNKAGVKTFRIPSMFPMDETTVQHCPVFAQGRNILGVILMQLREMIRNEQITIVDMTNIYKALRVEATDTKEPMDMKGPPGFITDTKKIGTF